MLEKVYGFRNNDNNEIINRTEKIYNVLMK